MQPGLIWGCARTGEGTALITVPGASHGGIAARPSQSAAKASAILAWFEKYKKGWSPPPTDD